MTDWALLDERIADAYAQVFHVRPHHWRLNMVGGMELRSENGSRIVQVPDEGESYVVIPATLPIGEVR